MSANDKQINGDHYRTLAIQPSEYIYRNKLGWHEGNAVKYITRHRIKGGRTDIEKAIHYLELLLEAEYGEQPIAKPNAVIPIAFPGQAIPAPPARFREPITITPPALAVDGAARADLLIRLTINQPTGD